MGGTRPATNTFAIVSLVLGILWILGIGSVLAVVFGHLSLRQIHTTGENGRGMAIAGLVLGYVGAGFLALGIIFVIIGAVTTTSGPPNTVMMR